MSGISLTDLYRAYIDCLNRQDWDELGRYVDNGVVHNGRRLGLSGYRDMLVKDFEDIPDLHFKIQNPDLRTATYCGPPCVQVLPEGKISRHQHQWADGLVCGECLLPVTDGVISSVWSVIDKSAIEAQLG